MRSNTVCAFIFARMSCWPDHLTRQFHSMQESLEQAHDLGLTRFLWMHEILGRLPFTFNAVGQEIINFDDQPTRNAFVDHIVELDCQGRTKTRPEWRRKIRPSGRPVACLKVAVRVG